MASRVKNITIDQGTDFSFIFPAYLSSSATAKIVLTSEYYANSQMRKSGDHINSTLTFLSSIDTSTDVITISANNLQTSVPAGRYLYEVVLTDSRASAPIKTRVLEGVMSVIPSVEVGSMYTINSTGYDVRSSYT